jgi:hypothetical protein
LKPLEDKILGIQEFKAKDVFNIISVTQNEQVKAHMISTISTDIDQYLPEEIVILLKNLEKLE